jgi:hypothetical protein
MMRKFLQSVLIVLFTSSLIAQNSKSLSSEFIASNSTNPLLAANSTAGDSPINYLSAAQARQYVRSAFNLLRDYTVSIDEADITQSFADSKKEKEPAAAAKVATSNSSFENLSKLPDAQFDEYLKGMQVILKKKIEKSETDSYSDIASKTERQGLLRRLQSIMNSAACLVNKADGIFIKSIDLDGNDIIAFRLDSLRKNSRYSLVENYREGLSRIRKDQVYGYIDYCGQEVIPAQYEYADAFNSGKALVKKVNWYFIGSDGEESDALEGIMDAKALRSGVSLVKMTTGKFSLINNDYDQTKQLIASQFDAIDPFYKKQVFRVRNGKKLGLINLDGNVKLPILYDIIEGMTTSGLFKVKNGERWGLIDSVGNVKFNADFISISEFDANFTAQAVDEKGIHLISAKDFTITRGFASVGQVNKFGVAIVRDAESKLFGLINTKLETVVKPTYLSLESYNKIGLASACIAAELCGYIDNTGKEIIPLTFASVGDFSPSGFVAVKAIEKNCAEKCNYEMVLDKTGKVIIPKAVKNANKIKYAIQDSIFSEKYISVIVTEGSDAGFQLINNQNLSIVNSTPYKTIAPLDVYGMMRVSNQDDDFGMIDSLGKVSAKCAYKEIRRGQENYYPARDEKGKWGFIDKKGKPQIPFEYEEVRNFRNGFTIVQKDKDKFGVINRFNAKVVPTVFKTAVFSDSKKYILTEENGTEIILNDKLDCEKGCTRLDEIRRAVNQ